MIKIYIASPYTNGDKLENVHLQMKVSNELLDRGYAPYTPLLTHFQEQYHPRGEHDWLKLDFEFLACCDVLIRIKPIKEGHEILSPGADKEEEKARELGIPVFWFNTVEQMCDFLDTQPFETI